MSEPEEVTLKRRLVDMTADRDRLVACVSHRDSEIEALNAANAELRGKLQAEHGRCVQMTQSRDVCSIELAGAARRIEELKRTVDILGRQGHVGLDYDKELTGLRDEIVKLKIKYEAALKDLQEQLRIKNDFLEATRREYDRLVQAKDDLQTQIHSINASRNDQVKTISHLQQEVRDATAAHAPLVEERDRIANQRNKYDGYLKAIANRLELGSNVTVDRMLEVIDGLKRRAGTTVDVALIRAELHKYLGDCYKAADLQTTDAILRAIAELARKARVNIEERNVLFNTLEKFTEIAGIRAQGALAYDGTDAWANRVWGRAVEVAGKQYADQLHNWEAMVRDRDREIAELRKCNDKQAEQLRDCVPSIKENYKKLLAKLLSLKLVTKDYCVNDHSDVVINDLVTEVFKRPGSNSIQQVNINWECIPDRYNWVAMDKNGQWYAYVERPQMDNAAWIGGNPWLASGGMRGNIDWDKSLVARPGITTGWKPVTPAINWDTVPKQYNWAAMDGDDGQWFAYDLKPVYCDRTECWEEPDRGSSLKLSGVLRWSASAAGSLVQRPAADVEPPDVCWSGIPRELKWAAMDMDGRWYAFVNRPTYDGGIWSSPGAFTDLLEVRDTSVAAADSLVMRPC